MQLPTLHRIEWLFVCILVVLGGFLRHYHIDQTLMFLSDQGRDAIIAKRMLVNHDPIFIGPVTSVGNMYLGPFYYYFMVPFLALTYPNPIGPAVAVAFLNTLSIIAIYMIGRSFWNKYIGGLAALFLAFLPMAIQYSRFSWNPNLAIPVALGLFYFLVKWSQTYTLRQALFVGLCTGILIQLHYVTLTVVGVIGVVWLYGLATKKLSLPQSMVHAAGIVMPIIILLSPLMVFNFRHQDLIEKQFTSFFTSKEQHIQPISRLSKVMQDSEGRLFRITSQILFGDKHDLRDRLVGYGLVFVGIYSAGISVKKKNINHALAIAGLWIMFAVVGTAFYSSSILDHYLLYCIPIMALVWSVLSVKLFSLNVVGKAAAITIGIIFLLSFSHQLQKFSFTGEGLDKYKRVVDVTLPHITGRYNIVLLSEIRDIRALSYRYFFETTHTPPLHEDMYTDLDQLIIIDEQHTENPLDHQAYEIQAAGMSVLAETLQLPSGVRVYIYNREQTAEPGVQ